MQRSRIAEQGQVMRDLVAMSKPHEAGNGHARDLEAESRTKALNMANDLLAEIRSRWPHESTQQHVVRLHRAASHSTDADLFEMFFPSDDREYIEVQV